MKLAKVITIEGRYSYMRSTMKFSCNQAKSVNQGIYFDVCLKLFLWIWQTFPRSRQRIWKDTQYYVIFHSTRRQTQVISQKSGQFKLWREDNKWRSGHISLPLYYPSVLSGRSRWLNKYCRSNRPVPRWQTGWEWGVRGKSDTSLCGCDLLFSVWSSPPPNPSGDQRKNMQF